MFQQKSISKVLMILLTKIHLHRQTHQISAEDSAKYGIRKKPGKFDYCYDIQDSSQTLKRCIVEVIFFTMYIHLINLRSDKLKYNYIQASNTPWGESVTFVFNPSSDLVPKSEYISPFMVIEFSYICHQLLEQVPLLIILMTMLLVDK